MGIYLGQLPPAEIARLKAELAETIIANFCYPRFFDYRTNSLRMRPVDRSKRQEVWLYLSSVDFTAWNRVDLMSPDLQRHIERLFIQFVQRNRNFFGQQGRKRMPDVRTLITTSSSTVVQSLRNHVGGHRQERQPAFGSPRPVTSWSIANGGGRTDLSWEQVSAMTLLLQQQLQESRGEAKYSSQDGRLSDARPSQLAEPANQAAKRDGHTPVNRVEQTIQKSSRPASSSTPSKRDVKKQEVSSPSGTAHTETSFTGQSTLVTPSVAPGSLSKEAEQLTNASVAKSGDGTVPPASSASSLVPTIVNSPTQPVPPVQPQSMQEQPVQARIQPVSSAPVVSPVPLPSAMAEGVVEPRESREMQMMLVADEDIVIFEQLRHQMILWLRVEAVHAGIEMNGQTPPQLLDLLRRQERFDETRLQVVSTLLNLANQVIKNKCVSVLDYKQALMFHLMHTRR